MKRRRLAARWAFDLRVLSDMRCPVFDFKAYRTASDLRHLGPEVTDWQAGQDVTNYRWIFHIRTHVSADDYEDTTEIRVFTDVPDYPRNPPGTEILSPHVPWSPHFRKNTPVCIAPELWLPVHGYIPLGALAIHIAHLLNWDEAGRGGGYTGYRVGGRTGTAGGRRAGASQGDRRTAVRAHLVRRERSLHPRRRLRPGGARRWSPWGLSALDA